MQHDDKQWIIFREWLIAAGIVLGIVGWVVAGMLLYGGHWS